MSSMKKELIYLTEEETIRCGVTDMRSCLEVMVEVFELLSAGDYVMGGHNKNSHGIEIEFPKESRFPNMPLKAPDRRFMAMCAYLGGRFDICGVKWYGSNIENRRAGLPRSNHTVILSDQKTGLPVAIMPGNLVSSMRTGAVPGVGATYLAKKNTKTLGLIGAGVISKTSAMGILTACPGISEVKIYDIDRDSSARLAAYLKKRYEADVSCVDSVKEACAGADVINVATSGPQAPEIDPAWLKPGVLLSLPANIKLSREFVEKTKIVVDNWKLYESWRDELAEDPRSYHDLLELIGGDLLDYVLKGTMDPADFTELGHVVTGAVSGRTGEDETIIFGMGGMPVEDVAWACQIYQNALKRNAGQKLKFWDEPHMV